MHDIRSRSDVSTIGKSIAPDVTDNTLAMRTLAGSHTLPSVIITVLQLSNSYRDGTRDSKYTTVPSILNGMTVSSNVAPNKRVLSVGSSDTVTP